MHMILRFVKYSLLITPSDFCLCDSFFLSAYYFQVSAKGKIIAERLRLQHEEEERRKAEEEAEAQRIAEEEAREAAEEARIAEEKRIKKQKRLTRLSDKKRRAPT